MTENYLESNQWREMYLPKKIKLESKDEKVRTCYRFKIGDTFRIRQLSNVFTREYDHKMD